MPAPASPRDGLVRNLTGSGWLLAAIETAGLARAGRDGRMIDRIRDRLLFAFRDDLGQVVGVTGRARPDAPEGTPKHLNTPRTAIFHESRAMLGWGPEAVGRLGGGGVPVLVEGPFDVLAVQAVPSRTGGPTLCRWQRLGQLGLGKELRSFARLLGVGLPVGHRGWSSHLMGTMPDRPLFSRPSST